MLEGLKVRTTSLRLAVISEHYECGNSGNPITISKKWYCNLDRARLVVNSSQIVDGSE